MGDGEINPGCETLLTETNHINKVETNERGEDQNTRGKNPNQYPYL